MQRVSRGLTGRLAGAQVGAGANQQVEDPYANEPQRHPALVVRTAKPFNAETPAALLAGASLTPVDLFYVRNHLPVPHIDPATHSVRPTVCSFLMSVRYVGVK